MTKPHTRVKFACYCTNITMAIVGNLSPLLFLTFNRVYGISFTLLGLLVLINFATQLTIDLIFSFFSHKFNIPLTVKITPVIAVIGLAIYALWPYFFGDYVYIGIVIGTVIFSASSGLAEVLISPTIAAIPAENPDHEMSKLHSIYAWGVVGMVIFGTAFIYFIGDDYWQILALIFALVPLLSAILFSGAEIPKMETPEKTSGALEYLKKPAVWLSVFAIFLGGASEVTMNQWASGYLESMGIDKIWGDVLGVALFGLSLGIGRTLYSKIGKNVHRTLFFGSLGATACYLIAALANIPALVLIACALTGFCVSMLWPGNLIVASDKFPHGGVFIFAMMAAGGDMGASIGPQLVGALTDIALSGSLGATVQGMGMRFGILVCTIFPLLSILVTALLWRSNKKKALPIQELEMKNDV